MKVTSQYLKYTFSEKELKNTAQLLANETKNTRELEEAKKSAMSDFAAKIALSKANVSKYATGISNGYEYRDVECEIRLGEPEPGQKTIIRRDTKEVVDVDIMTADELQGELEFQEANGKKKRKPRKPKS